jgi:tetratricopeptide (TPR) repeat protein
MNLTIWSFRSVVSHRLLSLLIAAVSVAMPQPVSARLFLPQADEQQESRQTVERLFVALVRNPRFGASFDRVIRWHNQQGSLAQFQADLVQYEISVRDSNSQPAANNPAVLPVPRQCTGDAAILLAGMIALHRADTETAVSLLERASSLRPADPLCAWYLARARVQQGNTAAAAAAWERALQLRPGRNDLLELYREYATALTRNQQPEQGMAVWQRLEAAFPADRRVAQTVAETLSREGRWSEALPRFQKLAETSTDAEQRVQLLLSAVDMLQQLKRDAEALQTLTELLADVEPAGWLARDIRRRLEAHYLKQRGPAQLAEFYQQWLVQHPDDLAAMDRIAAAFQMDNRPADAERWLRRAVELAPSQASLRESLIELLVRSGKLADALQQYELLCPPDGGTEDQRRRFGLLQLQRTDISPEQRQQLALLAWSPLLTLADSDAAAASRAADLLEQAGLPDRALQMARAAVSLAPTESQYVEQLGDRLLKRQQPEQAREVWLQLTRPPLQNAQNLILAAGILRRAGFILDAVQAMRQACQLQPALSEHLQFADLLREAGGFGEDAASRYNGMPQPAPDACLTEALQQLDLALAACESEEQQDTVLEQRTRLLLLAGRLNPELAELEQSWAAEMPSEKFLNSRRRALGYEATGDLPAAVAAARQAVQLQPASAGAIARLATLLEKSGRLSEAASALESLVHAAPRQASATLQHLARLELRLGRSAGALAAASRLTESWPDNPASWQFLAEIAFEVGRPADALVALRNAVRVSPRDTAALQNLANVLADQFETAEAVDLLWQAYEIAADQDARLELLTRMTALALRSQRFPEFQERLQRLPRNPDEPLAPALELSQVLQESGDFRQAREVIEAALAVAAENELLLRRAVTLAERERNTAAAARWQLQLVRRLGTLDEVRRLLTMPNVDFRQFSAAELLREIVSRRPQRALVHDAVRLALSVQQLDVAAQLAAEQIQREPGDWWCRTWLAILARRADNHEASLQECLQILALRFPASTGPLAQNVPAENTTNQLTPQELDDLLQPAPEEPSVYADAVKICLQNMLDMAAADDLFGSELLVSHNSDLLAATTGAILNQDAPSPPLLKRLYDLLLQQNSAAAVALRLRLLAAPGLKTAWQNIGFSPARLKAELTAAGALLITEHTEWIAADRWFSRNAFSDQVRNSWRKSLASAQEQSAATRNSLLRLAVTLQDSSFCGIMLQTLASEARLQSAPADADALLETLGGPLLDLQLDVAAVQSALTLTIACCRQPNQPLTSSLLAVEIPGFTPFRHRGPAASDAEALISRLLGRLTELQPGTLSAFWSELAQIRNLTAGEIRLLQCESSRRRGDRRQLLQGLLALAAEWPADAHLRLWLAELLSMLPSPDQAISLAASVRSEDPQVLIAAQQLILSTAQSAGLMEAAVGAAKRLGELPLAQQQQAALIPALGRLGLKQEAAALEARLGRSSESRTSVLGRQLQQFLAAGKTDYAAEVAWELLRISSGGSLFSGFRPNDDRDDGGDRLQAIKALARMGRLQPVIDRHEAMLENAPDALPLMEVLAEFHEAAEHWNRVTELQDRMAVLSRRVPPGLRRQASELEKSGQLAVACDLYLQLQKSDSAAFYSELETFYQTFERCQRQRDFLAAVTGIDNDQRIEHARLLTTAAMAVIDRDGLVPEVEQTMSALLNIPEIRRLTLAAAVSRPTLVTHPLVATALTAELTALAGGDGDSVAKTEAAMAEILQICQGPNRVSLLESALVQLSTEAVRAAPQLAVLAFISMRQERYEQLPQLASRIAADLAEAFSSEDARAPAAAAALMVMLEKSNFEEPPEPVLNFRLRLLQGLAAGEWGATGQQERAELALLDLYRNTARNDLARELVLKRIQTLSGSGNSGPPNIRSLLQASEQIQHSGSPIEAAELLLQVTPFDLERFTRDLGEDKAIAFRSRWNAARRWNLQQMTAERILTWLDQPAAAASSLLLELVGTTDPGCGDLQQLHELKLQSQLLTAVGQGDWSTVEVQQRLRQTLLRISENTDTNSRQLIVAAAAARSAGLSEFESPLHKRLIASMATKETDAVPVQVTDRLEIPVSLRNSPELAALLLARRLTVAGDRQQAELLLTTALPKSNSRLHRFVQIAVFNEALLLAEQLSMTQQTADITARRNQIIADHLTTATSQSSSDIQTAVEKLLQAAPPQP